MKRLFFPLAMALMLESCDCIQSARVLVLTEDAGIPIEDVKVTDARPKPEYGLTDKLGQYEFRNISGGLGGCPDFTLTFEKEGFETQSITYKSCCTDDTVYLAHDAKHRTFHFEDALEEQFADWVAYQRQIFQDFDPSAFLLTNEQPFSDYVVETDPPEDYHKMIRDYLFYSPDSTKILDIYSQRIAFDRKSNGKMEALFAVDAEIFYFDLEAGTRNRILFVGPSYGFDEAAWISEHEILVVGDRTEPTFQPVVWYADLNTKELRRYVLETISEGEVYNQYLTEVKLAGLEL